MNDCDLQKYFDNGHALSKSFIGISITYTFGGVVFNLWGNHQEPELVDALMISLNVPEGARCYQSMILREAFERKGLKEFIIGFEDRFYFQKKFLNEDLKFLNKIPWLRDSHRSATIRQNVKHEVSKLLNKEIIHKSTLSILFHRDFVTLEQRLEAQTFKLSKVKNGRDVKSNADTSCGSAFPIKIGDVVYFITAAHVVQDFNGKSVELKNPFSDTIYCKEGKKSIYDFQMLDLGESIYSGPTFSIGKVENCELADTVYVCGYPGALGERATISLGHISKLNADFGKDKGLIQISSAAVNPQNSGGPVTDYQGNIIGVLVMRPTVADKLQNVAFVEPIDRALKNLGIL